MRARYLLLTSLSALLFAAGCSQYRIEGTVTGLGTGDSIMIMGCAGGSDVTITQNGNFTLMCNDGAYKINVQTMSGNSTCTIANGSGQLAGHDIDDVKITCTSPTPLATVSSTYSGLIVNPNVVSITSTPYSSVLVIATLRDPNNQPIANLNVPFTFSDTSLASFDANTPTRSMTGTTDNGGEATVTLYPTGTKGAGTVVAAADNVTMSATVVFGAPISTSFSTLIAEPGTMTLGTTSCCTVHVTVTVVDVNDERVAGQLVAFSSSDPTGQFTAANANTDASGVCSTSLSFADPGAEEVVITAVVQNANLSTTVSIVTASERRTLFGGCAASQPSNVLVLALLAFGALGRWARLGRGWRFRTFPKD